MRQFPKWRITAPPLKEQTMSDEPKIPETPSYPDCVNVDSIRARVEELHANGERLKEAADGWKAEAERLRGIELALKLAESRLRACQDEMQHNRAMLDKAVQKICRITALIQADDVVLPDGRRFKFHPPDELVREAWEGLSQAIRDAAGGL